MLIQKKSKIKNLNNYYLLQQVKLKYQWDLHNIILITHKHFLFCHLVWNKHFINSCSLSDGCRLYLWVFLILTINIIYCLTSIRRFINCRGMCILYILLGYFTWSIQVLPKLYILPITLNPYISIKQVLLVLNQRTV